MLNADTARCLLSLVETEGVVLQEPRFDGDTLVCRITLDDSTDVVVKKAASREAFICEQVVLQWLNRQGFPVPKLLYADADELTLFTQWCPGTPLMQVFESRDEQKSARAAIAVARSFARLESLFAQDTDRLLAMLPKITPPSAMTVAKIQTRMVRWYERLACYFDWKVRSEEKRCLHNITEKHARAMVECSQSLGLLGCASDDVLVCGGKVTFLDFEHIGYDWPDARLYWLCSELFDRADKGARRHVIRAYIGSRELHGHFLTEEEVMSRILAIADHNHLAWTAYLARIVRSGDESGQVSKHIVEQRLDEAVDSLFHYRKDWFPGIVRSFSDFLTVYHPNVYTG